MLPTLTIHTTPDDIKYVLFEKSDVVSDVIRSEGVWNPNVLEIADKILSKLPESGKVYDVGAGIGTFCIPLALRHGEKFTFHAFEAQRILTLQLSANILLNNLDCVKVHHCVMGSEVIPGLIPEIDIEHSNNHQSFSLIRKMNVLRGLNPGDDLKKDDILFKSFSSFPDTDIQFVKISVCGMEFDVLEGAAPVLVKNNHPPVLFESWDADWYKEFNEKACRTLIDIGYEYFHDLGSHKVAFKSVAEFNYYMQESTVVSKLGNYDVAEHKHNAAASIEFQESRK